MDSGNDKDSMNGRFLPGHQLSRGHKGVNPTAAKMNELKRALLALMTEGDLQVVYEQLMGRIREGDVTAIRLWFEYGLGKAQQQIDITGLEVSQTLTVQDITAVILAVAGDDDSLRARIAAAFHVLGRQAVDGGGHRQVG